jgi:hypothetical protein
MAGVRRLLLLLALALVLSPAALASPTVRLTLIHVMQGCHVWGDVDGQPLGAARTLKVKPGTRVSVRITCPMDFDIVQTAGPKVALGGTRWHTGTTHALVFAKKGTYRFTATNVQTPEEVGLETIGPVNVDRLTVVVR